MLFPLNAFPQRSSMKVFLKGSSCSKYCEYDIDLHYNVKIREPYCRGWAGLGWAGLGWGGRGAIGINSNKLLQIVPPVCSH